MSLARSRPARVSRTRYAKCPEPAPGPLTAVSRRSETTTGTPRPVPATEVCGWVLTVMVVEPGVKSVLPDQSAKFDAAFDDTMRLTAADDAGPVDPTCTCTTCQRFSRAYLRHLFVADEMLGPRLLSLHNVHFLITLVRAARAAVAGGTFQTFADRWLDRYFQTARTP